MRVIPPARPAFPALLFSLALGPHPQRELTLMPRLGFSWPRLGIAAGAPFLPLPPCYSIIALSSATRSTPLNFGITTSTIPPEPSLTGSAAARIRTPA